MFLEIAKDIITHLADQCSPVKVTCPPVEYIVNRAGDDLIVTLVNNEATDWNGTITTEKLYEPSRWSMAEWWEDVAVSSRVEGDSLEIDVCVPPWSFKVIGVCREYQDA